MTIEEQEIFNILNRVFERPKPFFISRDVDDILTIKDDFAIEFLIWASQFALQRFDEDRWQVLGLKDFGFTKTVSTKEILEEFKKEKRL